MARLSNKVEEVFSSAALSEERMFTPVWRRAVQRLEDIFEAVGLAEGGDDHPWTTPYWKSVKRCLPEDYTCIIERDEE